MLPSSWVTKKTLPKVMTVTFCALTLFLMYILCPNPELAHQLQMNERRSSGSATAASDLYGTGIRIGLYLQSFGMMLNGLAFVAKDKRGAVGVKLICASNIFAVLAAWSALCRSNQISPAEAWIVLNPVSVLFIPASVAMLNLDALIGEALAIFLMGVTIFWIDVAQLWFWATLYRELPNLGTPGIAWIFAKVKIDGGFRDFMLFSASSALLMGLVALIGSWVACIAAFKTWQEGEDELEDIDDDARGCTRLFGGFLLVIGAVTWVFSVAGVEVMIKANDLTPTTDMSQPGQAIPFAFGLVTLADGILAAVKMIPFLRE
jgi:hypothetical protein